MFFVKFHAVENLRCVLENNDILFHVREISDDVNFYKVEVTNNSYLLWKRDDQHFSYRHAT